MKKEKLNPVVIATNIICAVLLLAMVAVLVVLSNKTNKNMEAEYSLKKAA